ncbi:MAG: endolytic transglycosylase MltG [Clostridia bacterium]|nr:endolytic transglycosylase MltG [Clostridia bacterium]
MKKGFGKIIFIAICIILIVGCFKTVPVFKEYFSDSVYDGDDFIFTVDKGATYKTIAQKLEDKDIIKSKYTFMVKYRMNSSDYGDFKYGDFVLGGKLSLEDIIKVLTSEPSAKNIITVTIPEGFSVDLVAQRMANSNLCTYDEFVNAVQNGTYDHEFLKYVSASESIYKLEGFLFPDTYQFEAGTEPEKIVDTMLTRFENIYVNTVGSYDDFYKIMTVASLIEREATLSSERPLVSGVIYNRLKIDMLLQIDASVIYGKTLGKYDMEVVLNKDLEDASAYNVYKNKGLPPGPICNPGRESIDAAANPASHDYLYYHTDTKKNDGSHIFTKTFDEHLETMN